MSFAALTSPAGGNFLTTWSRAALLWLMYFMMCFGLGYPTLNRYDPRRTGNSDAVDYYKTVESTPGDASGRYRYRVLVPLTAKPFYWVATGRVGTWNPVLFGLLMANCLFCATGLLLLVMVAFRATADGATAVLASFLYCLNFSFVNAQLAGLVDSAEACAFVALTYGLITRSFRALPVIAVFGALGKETFVPFSVLFSGTWLLVAPGRKADRWKCALSVALTALSAGATFAVVRFLVDQHLTFPWAAVAVERRGTTLANQFLALFDRTFLYTFLWLLPLGIVRLRRMPREWLAAATATAALACFMGAWGNSGGNAARPLFSILGGLLSVSAASFIRDEAERGALGLRTEQCQKLLRNKGTRKTQDQNER